MTQTPAEGTFRILVVGDSVTSIVMDQLPNNANLYTTLLAGKLNADTSRTVEVLNLSAPGLSLRQEIALIKARGLTLEPNLIVIAYCYNDPVETDIGPHRNWFGDRSEVAGRLSGPPDEAAWYDGSSAVYQALQASFAELGELARDHRVIVAGFPLLIGDRARQVHLTRLEGLTARKGIGYIDLYSDLGPERLPAFRGAIGGDMIHFNQAGHEAIAEALRRRVLPIVASK